MQPDVIVLGLGAMGSAALNQLARRGVKVLGIDRYQPPHDRGSSHGETRITRLAVGEGAAYVPLVMRSHAIWRELEAETGQQLLLTCGFLAVDGAGGITQFHGKTGFLDRTIEAAEQFGITHEVLTSSEAAYRFPGFRFTGDERCYYEPDGGVVFPERCIAAQLQTARRHGAQVRTDETVISLSSTAHSVTVTTDRGVHSAARVIVATGGWSRGLVPVPMRSLSLLRQTLHWYEVAQPAVWSVDRAPTFVWIYGPGREQSFYGFPLVEGAGTDGLKVAAEQYASVSATPEDIDRTVGAHEGKSMYDDHVSRFMVGVGPKVVRSAACFYTFAPDGDFVIGPLADMPGVTLVSACSGHGFKHCAGIGELIAESLLYGADIPDVFAVTRRSLQEAGISGSQ